MKCFGPGLPAQEWEARDSNLAGGSGCQDWPLLCLGASCLLKASYFKWRRLHKKSTYE